MADEAIDVIETPDTCEETTEYDNRIDDEIEPEEEHEDLESTKGKDEIEQRFARYERNYRARRIRELTLTPLKKGKGSRVDKTITGVAA